MLLAAGSQQVSITLAVIVSVGVCGQWLANRLRIPSVLLLLVAGITVGPLTGWIHPVDDLGSALFPVVGLAVGLLLFEGGLGLRADRLIDGRAVVLRLVTVGALVTWVLSGAAVWVLFDVSRVHAALIGAILVVSGPTVIGPLLQLARPREPSASILRWEGIIIDPIGATLAIVTLDAAINKSDPTDVVGAIAITLSAGAVVGLAAAAIALAALSTHAIPDHLRNPVLFGLAVVSYAIANLVAPEAGLMATTALGLTLANQRRVSADGIVGFSEDIAYLVLGSLFVTLGALVNLNDIADVLPRAVPLVAILVLVVRPIAVWASTVGTSTPRSDRRYVSSMAPRGIVAASVATVFANSIVEQTGEPVPELVPVVFSVVIGTVLVYGLSATFMAKTLRVARPVPVGIAVVTNNPRAVDIADLLAAAEVPTVVVSTSRRTQRAALERGILVYDQSFHDEELGLALDGIGIAKVLVITDDENLAGLADHQFAEHLGRANVHHVPLDRASSGRRSRLPWPTFDTLTARDAPYALLAADDADVARYRALLSVRSGRPSLLGEAPPSDGLVIALLRPDRDATSRTPADG